MLANNVAATELRIELVVAESAGRLVSTGHPETPATLSVVNANDSETIAARETMSLSSTPGTTTQVRLDVPRGRWKIALDVPGHWSAGEFVEVGAEPVDRTVMVWPTGAVRGALDPSPAMAASREPPSLPVSARLDFRPPPDAGSTPRPRGHVRCPIVDGRLDCAVPLGKHDIRLTVDGFSHAYRWDVRVRLTHDADLGKVTLGPATEIIGWVTVADGGAAADVEIRVQPRLGRRTSSAAQPSGERLAHRTSTDRRGFFQFYGLAPGAYVVEANASGYAPARTSVSVIADRETLIADPPIMLREAQDLSVYVTPPVPPAVIGEQWLAHLVQLDEGGEILERFEFVPCSFSGLCPIEGLSTGTYRLRVETPDGKAWSSETIGVDPSLTTHSVEIPTVVVRGTVTLGDEPLAASVYFGTANGGVELVSDQEGAFEGPLPRPGAWRVEVRAQEAGVRRNLDEIDVREDPAKGYAQVDIELPATLMTGSVVNEKGDPMSGAVIDVRSFDGEWDGWTQQQAEKDGTFALAGLPPGDYAVRASVVRKGDQLASSRVEIELEEAVEHAPVRLIVRADQLMRGRVVSHGVGVPGAQIRATSTGAMDRSIPNVISDADGRFEVALPGDVGDVIFGIGAPGFGYQITRRRYDPKAPQIFEVAQTGGTVVIDLGDEGHRTGRRAVLLRAGGLESVDYLRRRWARLHRGAPVHEPPPNHYVLPQLEPGLYQVCLTEPRQLDLLARTGAPHAQCVGGQLTSGGELTLALVGSGGESRDP